MSVYHGRAPQTNARLEHPQDLHPKTTPFQQAAVQVISGPLTNLCRLTTGLLTLSATIK
jgi:hypothetical protein